MTNTLPPDNHVARYCGRKKFSDRGVLEATAFLLDDGEEYLSTAWMEYFHEADEDIQLAGVRSALRQKLTPGGEAKLAVFEVGEAQRRCGDSGHSIEIREVLDDPADPSHAGIYFDRQHANEIATILAVGVNHRFYEAR